MASRGFLMELSVVILLYFVFVDDVCVESAPMKDLSYRGGSSAAPASDAAAAASDAADGGVLQQSFDNLQELMEGVEEEEQPLEGDGPRYHAERPEEPQEDQNGDHPEEDLSFLADVGAEGGGGNKQLTLLASSIVILVLVFLTLLCVAAIYHSGKAAKTIVPGPVMAPENKSLLAASDSLDVEGRLPTCPITPSSLSPVAEERAANAPTAAERTPPARPPAFRHEPRLRGHHQCRRCNVCPYSYPIRALSNTDNFQFQLPSVTSCSSKGVVYAIRCPCNKLYIGSTPSALRLRISQHRSSIRNRNLQAPLVSHYIHLGHSDSDLLFFGLWKVSSKYYKIGDVRKVLQKQQKRFIRSFQTLEPQGLNTVSDISNVN